MWNGKEAHFSLSLLDKAAKFYSQQYATHAKKRLCDLSTVGEYHAAYVVHYLA